MTREEIVVGLDIGTTKVGTVIAAGDAAGNLRIIGVGSTPSRGIKRGVVVDVEETVAAIQHSVERAAHMAGVKVEGAIVGVTGEHIESSNRHAAVTVAGGQGAIGRDDVRRVLQAAALEVPRDREIIHSLPRSFSVDGHGGVRRPIGMTGQKLEVETHIVTGKAPFLQNAVQCVERAGLKVEALVLEPIATAEAVTTLDEREMGVILIDIGGGTSDLAVFHDGSIVYSGVLPVGGHHVTRDIAIGLRTPFEVAENLKLESGAATREMIPHGEALEVIMSGTNERLRIPRAILGEIIEARMSELFELAREMMHRSGARQRLPGGVILSGGGALLPGAVELANAVFSMPVRLGYPLGVTGWSDRVAMPQLATGVGLCRFALTQRQSPNNQVAIPSIAALGGRRIWGAIASEEEKTKPPGFISESKPGETGKAAAPLAPAPISIAPPDSQKIAQNASSQTAPSQNASAPGEALSGASGAITGEAPVAATAALSTSFSEGATPTTEARPIETANVDAAANSMAAAKPELKSGFEAPRFEARPTRGESPRADSGRGAGVRTAVIRPGEAPNETSGEAPGEAPGEGNSPPTAESAPTRSGGSTPSLDSAARPAPSHPATPTESGARAGDATNGAESRGSDNIFRRNDSPAERPESPMTNPPVQQTWWDKLKKFLGFEKVDD